MAVTERAARIAPYVELLLEDEGARESLREGIEKVREAYERSQKRGVDPSVDKKLRGQLIAAAQRLSEGAGKLAQGREKPKKRGRKLLSRSRSGQGVLDSPWRQARASALVFSAPAPRPRQAWRKGGTGEAHLRPDQHRHGPPRWHGRDEDLRAHLEAGRRLNDW